MGMYSTAIRDDGLKMQFRGGGDQCEEFKIGDEVPRYYDPNRVDSDEFFDDVYIACGSWSSAPLKFVDGWVVVKDGKIRAMLTATDTGGGINSEDREELLGLYGINYPDPKSLYTQEALDAEADRIKSSEAEFQAYLDKQGVDRDSSSAMLGAALAYPLTQSLNYPSLSKMLLLHPGDSSDGS